MSKKSSTSERLKEIMTNRNLKQVEILEMCKPIGDKYGINISKGQISEWVKGRVKPGSDKLTVLSEALNVSPAWLMGYDVPMTDQKQDVPSPSLPDSPDILPIATQKIPLLGDIACGQPTEPGDTFEAYVEAGSEVKADFALRAHGESMTGARILDGDVVFIRSQPAVDDGEIAAVMIDGETTLKRVRHAGDDLVLWPENPSYQPIIISSDSESDVRVIGKAVAFQSDVK